MAKFKIKGKKLTGTKKKDKIVWQKSWKKNLTVNSLAGNDTIDFTKSKKTNTFIGGKGKDIIKTGKGTSTIVINKGDGNDTIYHNSKKTTIKVNKAKSSDNQSFVRNGNDLIMTYSHGGTKTKEVLTFKNYYKGNKNIYLGKQKLETLINAKGMTITGTSGNDTINGSRSNDTINAGKGNNTIYLNKNEGTDTILNGGGNDTLVFSQESNFDNFAFTPNGDDLNITAGGTTAIIKGYNSGKSSVKTIKAGNYSLNNIYIGDLDHDTHGTNGNDLFIFNDDESHYVYTEDGNDIIYVKDKYRNYYIYASKGNNYIDSSKANTTYLYLKGMNGNNTILPNWNYYTHIKFNIDEESSYSDHYEMIRTLQLAEGDGTFQYIIGQKSGNDLVMKAINGKTVTVKDFYATFSNSYFTVYDNYEDYIYIYRGRNENIFSDTPEAIKLTNEPAVYNNVQNKYIYGWNDIAYSLTMNNTSYNHIEVYGEGQQTINLQNAQLNYIELDDGKFDMTLAGDNNYLWLGSTASGSEFNITGNNNYIDTNGGGGILSSTINLNGTGNGAWILADDGPVTINTQGQNHVVIAPDEFYGAPTFNVNSTGNDYFDTGDLTRTTTENYNFNFTGSEGKNKEIETGLSNEINVTGINDVGELKLSMHYSKHYIMHTYGADNFIISDFNPNTMSIYSNNGGNKGSRVIINGVAGQGAADLNTTEMANKIKVSASEFDDGEYHTISDLSQYFSIGSNNFTFGSETEGYMDNLTKDYLVYSSSGSNTYSNFTFESGRHTIYDVGGTDTLTINETNLDTYDVRVYYNITAEGGYGSDLYFLKSSEYLNFMKGNDVSGYIKIQDAFNQGKIEDVRVSVKNNNFSLFYDRLVSNSDGSLIQEVASWLTSDGRNFSDTADVLNTGTDAEKTALFGIFDKHSTYSSDCYNPYFDS